MKVYLCGGINGLNDAGAKDWREAAKGVLLAAGLQTLDPMRRDYRGREGEPGVAADIVHGDLTDINNSDVVLVNATRPSWGTAMEVYYAASKFDTDEKIAPKVVAFGVGDNPSPWLVHHCILYPTLEAACNAVIGFFEVSRKPKLRR